MSRVNPSLLRDAFLTNGGYNDQQKRLIHILSLFVPAVIQDEDCLLNKSHGNSVGDRLHDIMCLASMVYTPLPVLDSLKKKGSLVNDQKPLGEGGNGRVFAATLDENPIITKAPTSFNPQNVLEIFVNMVIVNSLLMNNLLNGMLIPSYGLFVCPSNLPPGGNRLAPEKPLKICDQGTDGKPSIFLIQEKVIGKTYSKAIQNKELTFTQFQRHVRDIFTSLIVLEECPYRLSHNDFHTDNVMLKSDGNIVILDFGFASFTEQGHSYQPFTYDNYLGKHPETPLVTGAVDFFDFFKSVMLMTLRDTPKSEGGKIHKWTLNCMSMFSKFFIDHRGHPVDNWISYRTKVGDRRFYLFDLLQYIEDMPTKSISRPVIRLQHMNAMRTLTHRHIARTLFNDIMNWSEIDRLVEKSREPVVFDIPALPEGAVPQPLLAAQPAVKPAAVSLPLKPCGPTKGSNRWTKPELMELARQRGITANQSLDKLCKALGLPSKVVQPEPVVPLQQKACGPVQGTNRWTRDELITLAKQRGISPYQTMDKLCKALGLPLPIPEPIHVRISPKKQIHVRSSPKKLSKGCKCDAILQSGKHKGRKCGRQCVKGNKCGFHA